MALTQIDDRGLKTPIDLLDNEKIRLGTGNDLEIYHDGSKSILTDSGTGWLEINTNNLRVQNAAANETLLYATENGSVQLLYDNVKKFETSSGGAIIYNGTGNAQLNIRGGSSDGTATIQFIADDNAANDDNFRLQHGASNDFYLQNYASGGWETNLKAAGNGNVELYYNNVKKLETTTNGIKLNDSTRIGLGDNEDLLIYHDGSNSYLDNSTGALHIRGGGDIIYLKPNNSETALVAKPDAEVELLYNGSTKFETASHGITAFGDVFFDNQVNAGKDLYWDESANRLSWSDNVHATFGNGEDLRIYHDDTKNLIETHNGEIQINKGTTEYLARFIPDGAVELYHNNSKKFETTSSGTSVSGQLECGSVTLSGGGLALADNDQVTFGSGDDAFIKHTGSDLFFENSTGGLNIKCDSGTGAGEGVITFSGGSGTEFMRMNNLGDLLINQTSTNDSRLSIKQRSSAVDYINCRNTSDTLNMYCHSSGNLYNTNGNYSQISDQSLKENIVDAKSQWNDIKSIKIRNFNFTKASGMDTHTQIGCVAQEVEKVSPKLVTAPRSDGIKTVANSVLYMKAIKALQEAMAKIETLETKVAALEAA